MSLPLVSLPMFWEWVDAAQAPPGYRRIDVEGQWARDRNSHDYALHRGIKWYSIVEALRYGWIGA